MSTTRARIVASVSSSLLVAITGVSGAACKKSPPPVPAKIIRESIAYSNPKAKTTASGPLKVALVRESGVAVGTLSDGRVYVTGNTTFALATDDGGFEHDPRWGSGFSQNVSYPFEMQPYALGGRFPDDAWLVEATTFKRANADFIISHWENGSWKILPSDAAPLYRSYVALGPWKNDRTIALRLHSLRGSDEEGKGKALLAAAVPRFEIPGGAKAESALPMFAKGVMPRTFASLASGEVVALVYVDQVASVERWTADAGEGVVEDLPGDPELWEAFVTVSGNDSAWVGGDDRGKPYLAHFDGKGWAAVDVSTKGPVKSMAEAPDGTFWMVTGETGTDVYGAVWRRPKGATAFERVELPKVRHPELGTDRLVLSADSATPHWKVEKGDAKEAQLEWWLAPRDVAVSASGEPFVGAVVIYNEERGRVDEKKYFRSVVLRPRAAPSPFVLPSPYLAFAEGQNLAPAVVVDPMAKSKDDLGCTAFFLRVGDVPEDAPADFDPKELREAVRTVKPPTPNMLASSVTASVLGLEVRLSGKRAVGVYVPDCYFDECRKEVAAFAKTMTKKLPETTQALYCMVPIAVRDLKMTFGK